MEPTMFRVLTPAEEETFRLWARANYKIGDPIQSEVWHPIAVEEMAKMNVEAWRANPHPDDFKEEVRA